MPNYLVSSETADRLTPALDFVEQRGPSLLRRPDTLGQVQETRVSPNLRGVLMESLVDAKVNDGKYVQLKTRLPTYQSWLLRPKRGADGDGYEEASDFQVTVTTPAGGVTFNIPLTATASDLWALINTNCGASLNMDLVSVKLGHNAPLPSGGSAACQSWMVTGEVRSGIKGISVADDFMESILDQDSPLHSPVIKAYKYSDLQDLKQGTVVNLMDMPGAGYAIIGSFEQAPTTGTEYTIDSCGGCQNPGTGSDPLIDLTALEPDLYVSEFLAFNPFCSGLLDIVFFYDGYDSGEEAYRWNGYANSEDGNLVNCTDEDEVEFTISLFIKGTQPEFDGNPAQTYVIMTDGTNTWRFEIDAVFDPGQKIPMKRVAGPATCPCAPFRQFPCLRPLSTAGFEPPTPP